MRWRGQPAQQRGVAPPSCWFCDACKFHGNTVGLDPTCQMCNSKAKSDDDDGFGTWQCAGCKFESTGEVGVCDFCSEKRA